ncbi:MAG: pyridoxal-phosphate dependent enzyme [Thermoflexales bacterium]|nr:pyridoxal-phosphate dependent enzyme [Thermoflexales bacterium]
MATLFRSVACCECGHEMGPDPYLVRCGACGGAWLDARYNMAALLTEAGWPEVLVHRASTLWRYAELLPFSDDFRPISLGEGWTPLTRAEGLERETGHAGLWIKDERQQPTGSFKDRQASVAVSALKAQGITELALASTGNAAAAYAAFCARAGIKLWVFLTSSVPAEKMRELALYGAEVVKITGTYDQAKQVAADFAARRGIHLDGGAKAIPCKESMKTLAFEIAEQLTAQPAPPAPFPTQAGGERRWQAPDWYIQAVSGGIGPLGVIKGFAELYEAGLIDRVPKLGLVQTEGCSPMVQAWQQGLAKAEPVLHPDSLITVLATGNPGQAYTLLKASMDQYGGAMIAVNDGDAFRVMRRVARLEGFSMEPASSVAFAGLEKFLTRGIIKPGERVVVNCSGHTFSAEKHALEDRYVFELQTEPVSAERRPIEGLAAALEQLDEQVTTIVVIDDNPHDNRLIRRLLQSYKRYRVFEAYNGPDGIDLVRQRQPDLVVLDLSLPDMDGFYILGELKADERTCKIPVIVISAKTLTPDEQKYLRQYTDSVWQKGSFSPRELIGHVAEVLGDDANSLEALAQATRGADEKSLGGFGAVRRPRILLIEDNVWEARLMRRLFEARQRFEVIEAYSGVDALRIAEQAPPDLIILDLLLSDTTGEQLLASLRANEQIRTIPIVVVTAKDLSADERAELSGQVNSVWTKSSLDRNSLLAHVESLLTE